LSRNGEDWLLPLLATIGGTFRFFDILQKGRPDVTDGVSKLYAASRNPEIDTSKLTHFAMGVFWKASVHSWKRGETAPVIELGEYGESVRTFLLGETAFPGMMALTVGVTPPPVKMISFHYPYRGSESAYHNFLFYVPGIEFALHVGRRVPAAVKQTCFATNPFHPTLVCDLTPAIKSVIQAATTRAHRAKNVKKYLGGDPS
jgi:hypothetical protein